VPEAIRFAPAPAAGPVEETPPWEDDPADQPIGSGEDVVVSEEPTSGLVDQPDDSPAGGDPEREGGVEDAPPARQEEVEEAA
jgi:hypothetical protein